MHPVGPLSPTVYWLRRILAIVAAVAVLIGVVWFLANRSSRSSANDPAAVAAVSSAAPSFTGVLASTSTPPASSTAPTSPSPTPSPTPSPSPTPTPSSEPAPPPAAQTPASEAPAAQTPSETPASEAPAAETPAPPAETPAAEATPGAGEGSIGPAAPAADPAPAPAAEVAPPAPSYDAEGRLLCPDSAISVTAVTDPQFAAGQQANLSMVVTNTGTQACQRDVSGTLQVFTVLGADGSRQWSTADCFPGEGTEVRSLDPGQQVRYTVKWSGTTSQPGCAGDRVPVAPGSYSLVVALGGLTSAPTGFAVG